MVNHKGYLYVTVTGPYNFANVVADDFVFFWLGDKAMVDWTSSNADSKIQGGFYQPYYSKSVDLVAGQYVPFRVVYDNASNGGSLQFDINALDGTYINVSPTSFGTRPSSGGFAREGLFQRYSCDFTTTGVAPPFPVWGREYTWTA